MTRLQLAVAERGDEIYRTCYKAEYEKSCQGMYVVIDVDGGLPYVADTPENAIRSALEAVPEGRFHLILVGSRAAFKVGHNRCGATSGAGALEPK